MRVEENSHKIQLSACNSRPQYLKGVAAFNLSEKQMKKKGKLCMCFYNKYRVIETQVKVWVETSMLRKCYVSATVLSSTKL